MIVENNDTIAAISTPPGSGGIGVIRVSGPDSEKIARAIFRPSAGLTGEPPSDGPPPLPEQISPRRLYHGVVIPPGKTELLDEVLLVFMPAPHSYTCEDVVEIQAHAGNVVLKSILELVLKTGARLAEPGEFTRRAYLNGRIDLSQAEAIIDLIQAKTELSLKMASRQLKGALGNETRRLKEQLLELQAQIEAEIEFPEDVSGEAAGQNELLDQLNELSSRLYTFLEGYQTGRLFREGLRMTIVGRANVGKSSLLNRFLRQERAIVTEHPGTTRDSIEEGVDIKGLPVILVDTAGLRDTRDPIELIGIDRTRRLMEEADLVLFMVDADKGLLPEDFEIFKQIRHKEKMLLVNKIDLPGKAEAIEIPESWGFFSIRHISVKKDVGIEQLKRDIYDFGTKTASTGRYEFFPNLRQKRLFEKAYGSVNAALGAFREGPHPELMAIDMKEAMDALDEITGETSRADVMDTVFSRFCIGK